MTVHSSNLTNSALEHENESENYTCPLHGKEGKLARVAKIAALIMIIEVSLIGNLLVTRRSFRSYNRAFKI